MIFSGLRIITPVVFLALLGPTKCQESRLEHHLEHLTSIRNPAASNNSAWYAARTYIYNQFLAYKLQTRFHGFNTSVNVNGKDTVFTGNNIVGIAEGPKDGPVIVVGADYDTSLLPVSPLENNGAGVAVLLEIAKNFMENIYLNDRYNTTGTVLFVAFDINTRKYDGQSAGQPGSYHFVYQWLWPYLGRSSERFLGAFILDSISKYNRKADTQVLVNDFKEVFPEAYRDISNRGRKGDFLALVTRHGEPSQQISSVLYKHYNKERNAKLFRLVNLTLTQGVQIGPTFEMFDSQSHYHFWSFEPGREPMPLPAILLTDTDIHRRPADDCLSPCPAGAFLTQEKSAFLVKTVESMGQTLGSMLSDRPEDFNFSMKMMPSLFTIIASAILLKLLQ